MDGFQSTNSIRNNNSIPKSSQPYIIALTANAMQGDREQCLESGMNSYLSKPITISALSSALLEAYEHTQSNNNTNNTKSNTIHTQTNTNTQ